MAIPIGARFGPYEVIAPIGTGGMGEVYRARDTRLKRDVAIKILPAGIADNPLRRGRFEREAQAISRLNHPNICAVYDVGTQDGVAYLVMEYIDGESLAQRLRRGPLPAATAVRWAIQIAAALDAAHRRGIIHRDLKPANVMVTGQLVKLLDFGLAKLRAGDDGDAAAAVAALEPTISLTAERSIVGTLHYMAPEQLEGRAIDPRTDLFAFGAVLYEMLTARKAFDGASEASVMAAILTAEPRPVSSSAAAESVAPPALDRVVRRALAKDPDERWQTARDLMSELQWILDDGSRGAAAAALSIRRRGRLALLAVGAVALLAGFAARSTLWGTKPPVAAPVHLSFLRPVGTELTNTGRPVLAISPDGTKIVFNSNNQLYLRRLDAAESVPIPGTQGTGVQTPFFSADGRWVGFFSVETRELKRIPVDGGVAVTIGRSPAGSPPGNFGASWTADNQILFATPEGVFRVSADGGIPQKIIRLNAGETVHGPQLLPDGDHVLLTITTATGAGRWDKAQVIAQSLSSDARTVLIENGADGRYLDTGHIIYAVGTTLFAVAADVQSLRILGAPVIMLRDVRRSVTPAVTTADASVAISKTGVLAYIPDTPNSSINAWVDLGGRLTPMPDNGLRGSRVSRDGSQMVAMHGDAWWIYSLTRRAAPRRLAAAEEANTNPLWTHDGTRIVFRSRRKSGPGMFWRRADGSGSEELLLAIDGVPVGWSPDGGTLFYMFERELWSWKRGEKPRSLTSIDGPYASLSPDGRWVAFHAYEQGRAIPYVQSLSNPGERFQISRDGGHAPLWSPDGSKLFYVSGETNSLMAIDVQTTPTVAFGEPAVLAPEIAHGLALSDRWYDITPDGRQLLVQVPERMDPRSREIAVVLNWTEELKRLVPTR
jgi:Tol biopolymer transport system component/tRNA A-37 threonylcarbamoyl transferase component Bud32